MAGTAQGGDDSAVTTQTSAIHVSGVGGIGVGSNIFPARAPGWTGAVLIAAGLALAAIYLLRR